MKKPMWRGLLPALALFLLPGQTGGEELNPPPAAASRGAVGNVIPAASCSQTDVQAALNLAQTGDSLTIPAGNCTWSSYVSLAKELRIFGAGIDRTVIVDYGFKVVDGLDNFRISGFTWTSANINLIPITLGTLSHSSAKSGWRIDHNKFQNTGADNSINFIYGIQIDGRTSNAVIDHNDFYGCGIREASGGNIGPWGLPTQLGTQDFLFIETNNFYQETYHHVNHVYTGNRGARVVFRYNFIEESSSRAHQDAVDMHGYCHGNTDRGGRVFEIYHNTFKKAYPGSGCCRPIMIRGGTGVIYDNTFDLTVRSWDSPIFFIDYRASQWSGTTATCPATCSSAQWCASANGGEGYPCCDQLGRGQNQALEPVYLWNNQNQNHQNVPITVESGSAGYIQLNRDYYTAQKPGYTPYVYPHPLTKELALSGTPANRAIYLNWEVRTILPPASAWQISYYTQTVTAPLSVTVPLSSTRAYALTGLTNYAWYTVTLNALGASAPILTDTVRVMPTDRQVYLPGVIK